MLIKRDREQSEAYKEAAHLKGNKERRWTGSSRTPSTVVSGRLRNGGIATLQLTNSYGNRVQVHSTLSR